jgi:hypothetical protein
MILQSGLENVRTSGFLQIGRQLKSVPEIYGTSVEPQPREA